MSVKSHDSRQKLLSGSCVRIWWGLCLIPVRESLMDRLKFIWSEETRLMLWGQTPVQMPDERRGAGVWFFRASAFKFKCDRSVLLCVWQLRGGGVRCGDWCGGMGKSPSRCATGRRRGRWLFRQGRNDGTGQIWRVCLWGGGVGSHCVAVLGWWRVLCVFVWVLLKEPSITRPKVKFKFSGDESLWFKML